MIYVREEVYLHRWTGVCGVAVACVVDNASSSRRYAPLAIVVYPHTVTYFDSNVTTLHVSTLYDEAREDARHSCVHLDTENVVLYVFVSVSRNL